MTDFVHLHVHSEYSLLDGAIRLKDLVETARKYHMPAIAVTDHGNMFGALEFYQEAKSGGVKPIIGCEVYVAPQSRFDKHLKANSDINGDEDRNYHLTLLAKDYTGYKNLMELVTLSHLEGFYYKPRVDKEILQKYHHGIIALSGCLKGEIATLLLRGQERAARKVALQYREMFGEGNYYIEIQANGIPNQNSANEKLTELARSLGIPLVATNDVHYLRHEDARAHEILLCIQTGKTVLDEKRMKFQTDQLFLKPPQVMSQEFSHVPDALHNTVLIAEQCDLEIPLNQHHFPVFPVHESETLFECFERTVHEGFEKRMAAIRTKRPGFSLEDEEKYLKRLRQEVDVISRTGFAPYFLIVADFINYAKNRGIPVGPGRGSAAGSLVAYVMGITDLDPIEHGLIFERFLNLERTSMPDIDVDFCVNGREEVLKYVTEKYGKDRVAQITTFGTMQAKAVIRDVGRALAMPYKDVDRIAKLIPSTPGMTLKKAFEIEPRLAEQQEENPQVKELFEIALTLEGLTRHASTHAAGVVIADKPIVEYMPLYRGQNGEIVTQYSMKYAEKAGLIKFDFLGLRNLTVINNSVDIIRKNRGVELDINQLPLDDPETFALLGRADTTGVFQLESSGMRDILLRLQPGDFADIVALLALYRPGPLESGMVENYIQRKHGQVEVKYDLDELLPILKPTYGVILYQEQVMQIASALANYTLGEADILRRAMGKKDPAVMKSQRDRFLEGARQNRINLDAANHIFDLMEKFAGYGFNKSHSAAYALIAYQTAYLKAHYPVEFMAALLNSFLNNSDQVVKLINECREKSIEILPPDINASNKDFTVVGKSIRFGLAAVKNVGEAAVETILISREEKGPYQSIYDLCKRVDTQKVNRRVLEQLVKCGAFDSIHPSRAAVLSSLDDALERAQAIQRDRQAGQMNMYELLRSRRKTADPPLPTVPDWDDHLTIQYEKEALGFYISGHPLDFYSDQLAAICSGNTQSVKEKRDGSDAVLCGMLSLTKEHTTKQGERMAFLSLEDKEGIVEVVCFSDTYTNAKSLLELDRPLVVYGRIRHDEKGTKIIAERVLSLEEAQLQKVDTVRIRLETKNLTRDDLIKLRHVLMNHPGNCKTYLHLKVEEKGEAIISLNSKLYVKPTESFFEEVKKHFGSHCIEKSFAS